MERLLSSKERTLVMFDVVGSGLSSCLALVHKDIKQMTGHRNKLAQLEQEQAHAKLIPASELEAAFKRRQHSNYNNNNNNEEEEANSIDRRKISKRTGGISDDRSGSGSDNGGGCDDDPHHLAALRLLDKRLAESFSQVLSLNDMQRSSIAAKQRNNSNRASIFQVLLGKSSKQNNSSSNGASGGHDHGHSFSAGSQGGEEGSAAREDKNETLDNKMIIDDINRQIRLAMQYSKQLETHLLKVEDLKARYEMHIKMGLVVRSVSHAYLANCSSNSPQINSLARRKNCNSLMMNDISPLGTHSSTSSLNFSTWSMNTGNSKFSRTKNKQHAIGASKTSVKEFVDNINKIETELESFMGSFLFTIENIQGFARICQGDVFEIGIKLGKNKHKLKSKITILKGDKQKCDNRQAVFKAGISDVLTIKAYECKGLGKRVLLCNKVCETRDMFTARSQLMTISLNNLGSIKLNLIATWNPLHLTPNCSSAIPGIDISHISLPPTPVSRSTSTMSSMSSVPSLNGTTTTSINIQSPQRRHNKMSSSSIESQFHQQQQEQQHQLQQQQLHQELLYQAVNPNYSYYIPAPDYPMDEIE